MFCQLQSKGRMNVEGQLTDPTGLTPEQNDNSSPKAENDNSQQDKGSRGDNKGAGSESDSESESESDDDSVTSVGTSKGGTGTASIGPTGFNDLVEVVKELAVRPDLLNIPAFREKLASGLGEVVGERWSTWPHIMQLMVDDAVSFLGRDVRMSESFVQAYDKAAGRK